jgi:hypothetical protein
MVLDIALLSFARWQSIQASPDWFVDLSKIFRSSGEHINLGGNIASVLMAMKGYSSALRICKAGLILTTDLSVSVFMEGGSLIKLVAQLLNFRSVEEYLQEARNNPHIKMFTAESKLKNSRVLLTHVHHHRKLRTFGPTSNSDESAFECDGRVITVADYYEMTCSTSPTELLNKALPSGRLRYPFLPTINVGSKKRKILIPMELVDIPPGQSRPVDSAVQAKVIRLAAMPPNERLK